MAHGWIIRASIFTGKYTHPVILGTCPYDSATPLCKDA